MIINMDFPFAFSVENSDDSSDSSSDSFNDSSSDSSDDKLDIDAYNENLNNYNYQKCLICGFFRGICTLKTNNNVILYLCSQCRFNYIDRQFYNKLKLINKYILLSSVFKRIDYRKDTEYFISKLYHYHLFPNFNFIECLNEMDLFISHLRYHIIFHPPYPNVSTFISLLKNV